MKLMLVDVNAIVWRQLYANSTLFYEDKFTGGIFGFINSFSAYVNKQRPTAFLFCNDGFPYIRKDLFPAYKGDREKDQTAVEFANETRFYVECFLKAIGLTMWTETGLEADDLIYLACEKYAPKAQEIVITSADDDLYQCFKWNNVSLINSKGDRYTNRTFFREYKMTVTEWIRYSAICGTHNNIKGVPGLGKKKALTHLSDDAFNKLRKDCKDLDLFVRLIQMPIERREVPAIKTPKIDRLKLRDLMGDLGIGSYNSPYLQSCFTYLDTL